MVEEMYMEEIKEQEQNGSEDKTSKSEHNEDAASRSVLQEKGSVNGNQTRSFKSLDNSQPVKLAMLFMASSGIISSRMLLGSLQCQTTLAGNSLILMG